MLHSVSFLIEGSVITRVRVTGNLDGTLSFEFTPVGAESVGDLAAVFLDLNRPRDGDGFRVYGDAGLTEGACVKEGVDMLGRAARIVRPVVDALGDFDLGIVFGALDPDRGAARKTGFTLAHETAPLTLDMIDLADFGMRFARTSADHGAARGPRTPGAGTRGAAGQDALEVIEIQAARARSLAVDANGGVLAVLDLQGTRDTFSGATVLAEERGADRTRRVGVGRRVRPGRPQAWDGPPPLA